MANELKETAICGTCKYFKYTGSVYSAFCVKRKIVTKEKAVCGSYKEL